MVGKPALATSDPRELRAERAKQLALRARQTFHQVAGELASTADACARCGSAFCQPRLSSQLRQFPTNEVRTRVFNHSPGLRGPEQSERLLSRVLVASLGWVEPHVHLMLYN
jgi:hypothetical protein